MKSKITEKHEQFFINNIARLEWGKNTDTSFIKSTQLVLNSLGDSWSYDYLMGISGAAFRFHFHPEWCPSSADVTAGFNVSALLFDSIGYDYEFMKIDDSKFDDIKQLYGKIIKHINLGIPVIGINLKVCPEWGIITGYLKNKPGILCRTYFDYDDNYSQAEHAPWLTVFIGQKKMAMDRKEIFNSSLRTSVLLAHTDHFEEYLNGLKGLRKWEESLKIFIDSDWNSFNRHEENLNLLYHLIDSRRAAIGYLSSMIDLMKNGELIIDNYRKEVKLMSHLQKEVLPSYDSKPNMWTIDMINAQINTMDKIINLEKETIDLIAKEIKI